VLETYRLTGMTSDPITHHRPPPTLGSLQAVLDLDAEVGDEVAQALGDLLRPYTEGSLAGGLLHGETTVTLDRRLTVFGLLDLAEASWPVAMHLLAGWVWTQVRRQPGRQRLLVVDEVWRLLRHPAGAAFLETLARLARAAGLGLVAISQDVREASGCGSSPWPAPASTGWPPPPSARWQACDCRTRRDSRHDHHDLARAAAGGQTALSAAGCA